VQKKNHLALTQPDSNVPRMKAAALQVRLYHGKLQQLKIIMENTVCVGEGLLELF
jgi:hypothetical protein